MTTAAVNPFSIYKKTADALERKFPELWRVCYPRRYSETGSSRYDSPKSIARAMMDAFLNYHGSRKPGQTEQNEALWAAMMAKYGVPTYYLSHDMAVALSRTTPTEVLDCMAVKLPFEAAAFMLPTDVLIHADKDYGPVIFIAYTRNFGGTSLNCPHPLPGRTHELHNINDCFTVYVRTITGMMLHWTYSSDIRLIDLKNDEELEELQANYTHTSVLGEASQQFSAADIVIMTRAIKFLFNVVLLMTHRPETVEAARLLKRVNQGPGKPVEYWQPHIIGRNYKLRYEHHGPATGAHASPRGHWVSGFWREQPYGPKYSLRKTLWIEPFWRGGQLE